MNEREELTPQEQREALAQWLEDAPADLIAFGTGAKDVVRPDYLLATDVDWIIEQCRAPQPVIVAQGSPHSGGMTRDALIEIVMRETTDDIVADGWDHLGKPNALVQGCKFIQRKARTDPTEGYAEPDVAARKFAGFIADAVLAASPAQSSWQPDELAAAALARIAAANSADPGTDDLSVALAVELAEVQMRLSHMESRHGKIDWGHSLSSTGGGTAA